MSNHDDPLTLQDIVNHMSHLSQRTDAKIGQLEQSLKAKIDENTQLIKENARKIDEVSQQLTALQEDLEATIRDDYQCKHIFRPHTKQRLDRLEAHADLPPLSEPVPPV